MKKLTTTIILLFSFIFAANPAFAYTVNNGDTMTKIAAEHNLTLKELAELNPQIKNLDLIYIGDDINTEKPKENAPQTETVTKLDKDVNLLATLVRAEAHQEELAVATQQYPMINMTKTVNAEVLNNFFVKTEIADYMYYDIDLMARLVQAEAQTKVSEDAEKKEEVKPEAKYTVASETVVNAEPVVKEEPKVTVSYTDSELDLLARLVRAEAQTESLEGKIAVACVVLNRVEHPSFPDTIKEVIYERGQFQPVSNGEINKPADEDSIAAVKAALSEQRHMAKESLFFYNPDIATSRWLDSRETALVIGQHVFKN
ncbi:cell wall hydrolase [Neobacillus sp. D3-1R]|uniref:cell wall hydrolase n=1 Tax=Neobacillus sp. D3-1R TaxID=3445778 RepID=UPI003FA09E8E